MVNNGKFQEKFSVASGSGDFLGSEISRKNTSLEVLDAAVYFFPYFANISTDHETNY